MPKVAAGQALKPALKAQAREDRIGGQRFTNWRNPNYLKVVAKTFRVMESMSRSQSGAGVTELARLLKMPKATVFRILYTLGELSYVQQNPQSETYFLTEQVTWFKRDEIRESLRAVARPHMERLLARFEQTVNLGVLDRGQVLYVEMLEGLRSIRLAATVNTYAPLHCTALGKSMAAFIDRKELEAAVKEHPLLAFTPRTITSLKALLKHLSQARRRSYAVDNEEIEAGARCVAAPVFNAEGKPFAAVSIAGPTSHIPREQVPEIAQAVMDAAKKISAHMGYRWH